MTGVRALTAAALLVSAACSHAPPRPPAAPPTVTWPEPPAVPRARLASTFPDPGAPRPARSFWRRALEILVGTGPEPAPWVIRPFGVAAGEGAWFIADPDAQAVLRLDERGPAPVTCRDREWAAPMGVASTPDGALLVADGGAGVVVSVQADGRCRILGEGTLERPTGVAVAGDRVLVADPARHEIVVLDRAGGLLGRWGGQGDGEGRFHFPTAVTVGPDGTVLVADALNFRIVRLSAEGQWLGAFGTAGLSRGDLARPKGVAVDGAGRVYVSDAQRDAVLVYGADGAFEYAIGSAGAAAGHFALPAGVAVSRDRLYVADSFNARVQLFDLVGGGP